MPGEKSGNQTDHYGGQQDKRRQRAFRRARLNDRTRVANKLHRDPALRRCIDLSFREQTLKNLENYHESSASRVRVGRPSRQRR
jgi:hypothetical protein